MAGGGQVMSMTTPTFLRNYRMEARLDYRETDRTLPGVVPGRYLVAVIQALNAINARKAG